MYVVWNADCPTGFYLINRLILSKRKVLAILIDDHDPSTELYIHPDTTYVQKEVFLLNEKMDDIIADAHCVF